MKKLRKYFLLGIPCLSLVGFYLLTDSSEQQPLRAELQMRKDASVPTKKASRSAIPSESTWKLAVRSKPLPQKLRERDHHQKKNADETSIQPSSRDRAANSKKAAAKRQTPRSQHIERLLQQQIVESKPVRQPSYDIGQYVKATRVLDPNSRHQHYVIEEHYRSEGDDKPIQRYVRIADQLVVRFTDSPSQAQLKSFTEQHELQILQASQLPRTYVFQLADFSLEAFDRLSETLQQDKQIAYFEGNFLSYPVAVPNDPFFNALWGLQNNGEDPFQTQNFQQDIDIDAELAWDEMTDCSSVPVAVLDTGIQPNHPDLEANVLANQGRDFTSNDQTDFIDRQGHGTHVAGTVGAVGNNNIGVTGVCWQAAIIPIKVLGDNGTGSIDMIVNGLMYASQTDAKVLNLSLGGGGPSQAVADAVEANTSAGIIPVMAAGNEDNNNDANPTYPASYPDPLIISVAAVHGGGDLAGFSNFGATTVDIAAPGENIASTFPTNIANDPEVPYEVLSGTSMASPHVAGAVALFWAYSPELTATQVRTEVLASSATGTFSKNIEGSRLMDLKSMLDSVKAKADFEIEGDSIKVSNSSSYTFQLGTEAKYSDISLIEVLHGDEVVGTATGTATQVSVDLPLGFASIPLTLRVTDSAGRVFEAAPVDVSIDVEKLLALESIDLGNLKGDIPCILSRVTEAGEESQLHEFNVSTERACQKVCGIVGPLTYSTVGRIECSTEQQAVYQRDIND